MTGSRSLTVKALAELIGVSPWTVYQEIKESGQVCGIPAYRIRSRVFFPREPFERLFPASALTEEQP